MESTTIKITLNENLYLRDPQETELGQRILKESIAMIDSIGFEKLTFKKIAIAIDSTEATVYRYFENKKKLLIYLVTWYWALLDYKIQYNTNNIKIPKEKLRIVIKSICNNYDSDLKFIVDENALYRIVISESAKAYLQKEVDEINKYGVFLNYKKLNKKIADMILEINPKYKFPNALVSTIIETAHQQLFFALHLPSLTNMGTEKNSQKIEDFLEHLLWSSLKV